MQSNQANKQAKVNFKVGDKVKFKEEVCVQFDHDHKTIYTVEQVEHDGLIAFVESGYAHPGNLELVSHSTPTKHKHYDLIAEWAKDPTNVIIQYNGLHGWSDTYNNSPAWGAGTEYRIKPKTKQVTRWKWAFLSGDGSVIESAGYYTEEEALQQFKNATPFKLEHTKMTAIEEV